ncbi:fimbrial protein [Burkholderia sp. Leaf177]|uniref:fimbrial protein n=1 Tax=Burkholderia sp. Leaf177 TaxID=1736287 RepID=UPI0009ECA46E
MRLPRSNNRCKQQLIKTHSYAALALISCFITPAFADCNVLSGGNPGTATITLPANLSVSRDGAAGAVLFDSSWLTTSPTVTMNCSGSNPLTSGYENSMIPVSGMTNVYQTGVQGIGIQVSWLNSISGNPGMSGGNIVAWPAARAGTTGTNMYGPMGRFRLQLIRTGPVMAGTFNLPTTLAVGKYGSADANILLLDNANASVIAPACTVQDTAKPVTMPVASGRYLPSIGSTTGDTTFSISLDCATPMSVAITFTDATDPGNVGTTLSLSTDSTAKGVGYQIVYNKTPINYGPDSSAANNVNQFSVAPAGTVGPLIIPFTARYVRTGAITPGSANAKATFTMSYQ